MDDYTRRTALKLFGGMTVYTVAIAGLIEGTYNMQEASKRAEIAGDVKTIQTDTKLSDNHDIIDYYWNVEINNRGDVDTFEFIYTLETDTDFNSYNSIDQSIENNGYVETVGADVFGEMVEQLGQYGGSSYQDLSTYHLAFNGTDGSLTYSIDFEELVDESLRSDIDPEELYTQTLDREHLNLNSEN